MLRLTRVLETTLTALVVERPAAMAKQSKIAAQIQKSSWGQLMTWFPSDFSMEDGSHFGLRRSVAAITGRDLSRP